MSKNIIFGTGPLGTRVMEVLKTQGHEVIMVNRSGKPRYKQQQKVTIVKGDGNDAAQVEQICTDADVVFHCAVPPYTDWPTLMPPLSMGILEGVSRTHARLVFGDNLYCYGPTSGAPLTEDLAYAAGGSKGKVRADIARLYLASHVSGKCPVTIGRGSDFFGPLVTNSMLGEGMFKPALEGQTLKLLGDISLPHTFTYIKDFAKGLVRLSQEDKALGQAWHIPNAPTGSMQEFLYVIEQEIGKKIKSMSAGKGMLSILGLFNPMMREIKEMLYEWTEDYIVDHSKYAQAFGEEYTPLDVAVKETVDWYRNR